MPNIIPTLPGPAEILSQRETGTPARRQADPAGLYRAGSRSMAHESYRDAPGQSDRQGGCCRILARQGAAILQRSGAQCRDALPRQKVPAPPRCQKALNIPSLTRYQFNTREYTSVLLCFRNGSCSRISSTLFRSISCRSIPSFSSISATTSAQGEVTMEWP